MLVFTLPAGLTILCLATLISAANNVCYHPNGSPSDDVPCNPNTPFSMCCSSPTACLASGLCQSVSTNGTAADTDKFVRATCTDMTWTSDVCPPFCMPSSGSSNTTAFNLNLSQNDVHIRQCHDQNQTFELAARFCCGFADEKANCCGRSDALFRLSIKYPLSDAPIALDSADGSPKPWMPLPSPSPSSSTSGLLNPCSTNAVALDPVGDSVSLSSPSSSSETSASWSPSCTLRNTSLNGQHTGSGTSDTSVPSTNPPNSASSPTACATSTPASYRPTKPTAVAAAVAAATALADITSAESGSDNGLGNSGMSVDFQADSDPWSRTEWSSRLSTGAVVGIGLGVSVAAAGLVTISVYFLARRRLYMKHKRKWEKQMKAAGGAAGRGGTAGREMFSLQTRTAVGKPAMVMLAGGQGLSPVTLRDLKDMGWETRSVSEASEVPSRQPSAAKTRPTGTVKEGLAPATMEPQAERTVTWFARHSIYEMG